MKKEKHIDKKNNPKNIPAIGVRFRQAGKIYYFDAEGHEVKSDNHVIVETTRGIECGKVVLNRHFISPDDYGDSLKSIMRVASPGDIEQVAKNKAKALNAYDIAQEKIKHHKLEMKLIDIELTFDESKIIFYFTADGRVDFRELVKDLAYIFRIRIELRQVGVRDEAKILSGIGICGRELCCATFLDEFQPVSIKMAKEQGLSLNPSKISGICGRLMCCLKYEEETYNYLNDRLPSIGERVKTPLGMGEVIGVHVLREKVKVAIRNNPKEALQVETFLAKDIQVQQRRKKSCDSCETNKLVPDNTQSHLKER